MRVAWSDHYAMGLEQLDHDHQQLFKMAERMIRLVEDTNGRDEKSRLFVVREGVKYLRNYFFEHAEREEAYMRQISYPDYAAHKRLHDEFRYIELGKYEKIVERGMCTRDEVFDFIGAGVGWLLEHIATADMAIVGKGILCQPVLPQDDRTALEREVNLMFAATLNLDLHVRIISSGRQWEALDEAIYQRRVYRSQTDQMEIISGIEKRFLIRIAQMVYGEELRDADALILSSLEIFGANFWRTLHERLTGYRESVVFQENSYLSRWQTQQMLSGAVPSLSALFDSDGGKFFVSLSESARSNEKARGRVEAFSA